MSFSIYGEGGGAIPEVVLPDVQKVSTPEDVFRKVSETIPKKQYGLDWMETGFVEEKYISPDFGKDWGRGDLPRRIEAYFGVNKDQRDFAISSSQAAIHQEVVARVVEKYLNEQIGLERAAETIAYVFLRGVKQVVHFHRMVDENTALDPDQKDALSFVINAKTGERYGSVFKALSEDLKTTVVSIVNKYMDCKNPAPDENGKTLMELCS